MTLRGENKGVTPLIVAVSARPPSPLELTSIQKLTMQNKTRKMLGQTPRLLLRPMAALSELQKSVFLLTCRSQAIMMHSRNVSCGGPGNEGRPTTKRDVSGGKPGNEARLIT